MSKVVVCRPVDGITINSEMEFLLDDEDCVRIFDNVEDAKKSSLMQAVQMKKWNT